MPYRQFLLAAIAAVVSVNLAGCTAVTVASAAVSVASTAVSVGVTAGSVAVGAATTVVKGAATVGGAVVEKVVE
ncbi:hypothetical protein [Noviherbaspirillum galbum]|uniref:Lipoprotein n=1 Tax=Noviherbaspirillum galbum TaxID=2709383 RepID=A0A6B3SK83_9BURK|nr:hypothetical protein [Noviherbaspirillum galbum]NEX61167.1 hypothetical protein [Noviherbaspirillum galbum]